MRSSYTVINIIGVPKESWAKEARVACTPAVAATLTKKGFTVEVEKGAGLGAKFRDMDYEASGAKIVDRKTAFGAGRHIFINALP